MRYEFIYTTKYILYYRKIKNYKSASIYGLDSKKLKELKFPSIEFIQYIILDSIIELCGVSLK